MLTEQQQNTAREYVKHFNMTKAMIASGYNANTAKKKQYMLLKDPEFCLYLKSLMDKHQEKQSLSAEMVLEELRRLSFSDVKAYYKWHAIKKCYVLKPLDELTVEQTAAIKSYTPGGSYELYSKDFSLDKLARYFKLYSEIDQTITNFVLMPELKIGGTPMTFNIGEAVPKRDKKS